MRKLWYGMLVVGVVLAAAVVGWPMVGGASQPPANQAVTVTNSSSAPVPVTGSVNATQSGTWNVGITGTANVSATGTVGIDPAHNSVVPKFTTTLLDHKQVSIGAGVYDPVTVLPSSGTTVDVSAEKEVRLVVECATGGSGHPVTVDVWGNLADSSNFRMDEFDVTGGVTTKTYDLPVPGIFVQLQTLDPVAYTCNSYVYGRGN